MPKDQTYHEEAIRYNEGLAERAETLAPTLNHEEIRRWCTAVGKQHRFHEKRHRSALNKFLAGQTPEVVEQIPDGLDVPEPADDNEPEPTAEEETASILADQAAMAAIREGQAELDEAEVSQPAVDTVVYRDGCSPHHIPTNPNCEFNPNGGGAPNA